jgi:hypothetical protein
MQLAIYDGDINANGPRPEAHFLDDTRPGIMTILLPEFPSDGCPNVRVPHDRLLPGALRIRLTSVLADFYWEWKGSR